MGTGSEEAPVFFSGFLRFLAASRAAAGPSLLDYSPSGFAGPLGVSLCPPAKRDLFGFGEGAGMVWPLSSA